MAAPFLSIITINYNDVAGLEATMASVLAQTYTDFEYIVIDGGSTDGSEALLKKHAGQLSYWISEPDTGIFNAMNKGIKQAKGQYLQFLNSGDVFTATNALKDFINHREFGGDIIYGDYQFENGKKVYPDHLTPLFFMRSSLPHQSTLFKKEVFDKMGLYDEQYKIASDRAFYIKSFLSDQFNFKHITYLLIRYDLNGLSNTKTQHALKVEEDEAIFEKYYGIYYKDYKAHLALKVKLNEAERNTVSGYLRRIRKKIGF